MSRKSLVVGNWKMELSHKGELEVARALKKLFKGALVDSVDIVVCPSFPSLSSVLDVLGRASKIQLGAQAVHWEEKGAWTGQVSVLQISPFVQYCIVGHSEQRELTGETDDDVQRAVSLLIRHGIMPVVCIGESQQEREADKTMEKVTKQMKVLLNNATRTTFTRMVLTYEPIWAISARQPVELPDPSEVAGVMLLMRKLVAARFGNEAAERISILYGGSVTPETIEHYIKEPGVNGVLVGSASVRPKQFVDIAKVVQQYCD